jgi:hypothetical protein
MDAILRYRPWVVMSVLLAVVIVAAVAARRGTGAGGGPGRPHVTFGARVQKLGATSKLVYTNGWVVTSGGQSIGVYAGSQAFNHNNGLFVILRQTRGAHPQRLTTVVVRGSGPVTLLRPATPESEQLAFTETLHFVTANGGTGTLDLSGDSLSLSH